jgi:hypothetical protein
MDGMALLDRLGTAVNFSREVLPATVTHALADSIGQ